MWITRKSESTLQRLFHQFTAVLVIGPRQSGKTALLQTLYPHASYVTLDDRSVAAAANTTPEAFLSSFKEPVILDEVQYAPTLFRTLKVKIDQRRQPGRYLLTGSQIFPMMQGVSESLAGRCGILNLSSLSWSERIQSLRHGKLEDFLFLGGFPELHAGKIEREFWYSAYVATYLERDVRNILNVGDLGDFNRLLRAAALRTSQVLSYSDLARDVGISPATAKKWLSVLVASGQIFLIESYHRNRGKRLVKSPKLVFADTGLACYLMGFKSRNDVFSSPLAGALWESFVTNQVIRHYAFQGKKPPLWYWRTPYGQEVDLIIEEGGGKLTAIECKLSEHPGAKDCAGLHALESFYGKDVIVKSYIACRTPIQFKVTPEIFAVDGSQWDGLLI
ncbi:MAG: ATP-binding protein [Elusimicrobia bacterium]|nr:ATP-binding protein [Elusimicrobiota bacterium]